MTAPFHQRWYVVCLTMVNQALAAGVVIYGFALLVPSWLEEFDVSRGMVMVAITVLQLVLGALSPVMGGLLDRFSTRKLLAGGVISLVAGLCLLSQVVAFWQVLLIYATLLPVGLALCGPLASQVMVSKWFADRRGLAIGISATGPSFGGLAVPFTLSLLIIHYDWQGAMLMASVICLVVLLPLNYIVLRYPPPHSVTPGTLDSPHIDNKDWTTKEVLGTSAFWIPVIGIVPISMMFNGVQFHYGALVVDLGLEVTAAAELIAVGSVSTVIGKLLIGSLADRVDHRKVYWLMAAASIASLVLLMGRPEKLELLFAAGIQGIAIGGTLPILSMMYSVRFGMRSFGKTLGMVHFFLMTGSLGSILSGWMFDRVQSYDAAFMVFAALLIPGIVLMRFLPRSAI